MITVTYRSVRFPEVTITVVGDTHEQCMYMLLSLVRDVTDWTLDL